VGRPVASGEVRIYDEAGNRIPAGSIGDIYLVMHGAPDFTYHNNDEARKRIGRDGLATCGDMGYLDEDGYLFICDRRVDMLISGGVNIYPAEVEGVLLRHPDIEDAVVFGTPDDEYGEIVTAHVQPRAGSALTEQAVRDYVRGEIAPYKAPRRVVFERLQREENGKINKRRIREPYWAGRERSI